MEGILNFNEPLNVELLDKVVNTFYQGFGAEVYQPALLTHANFPLIANASTKDSESISGKSECLAACGYNP